MHLRLALNSWPRFLYLQVLRLQIPHTTMSGFAWFSGRPQSQRHSYRFLLFTLSPLDPLCSLFHFEFWFVFLSFYFYLAYGCSVYAPCVCRALLKPEESIKSRGLEFLKVVSRHVSTGIKPRSSGIETSALTHWVILSAPLWVLTLDLNL